MIYVKFCKFLKSGRYFIFSHLCDNEGSALPRNLPVSSELQCLWVGENANVEIMLVRD